LREAHRRRHTGLRTGSVTASRSWWERVAKYNRLAAIELELPEAAYGLV
jgi:hypothetical protein